MCVCQSLQLVPFFAIPWTVAHQAALSMGFSRQEYWSGLLFPSPEDLLNAWIEPVSLMSPALAGGFFTTSTTWEGNFPYMCLKIPLHATLGLAFNVKFPASNSEIVL